MNFEKMKFNIKIIICAAILQSGRLRKRRSTVTIRKPISKKKDTSLAAVNSAASRSITFAVLSLLSKTKNLLTKNAKVTAHTHEIAVESHVGAPKKSEAICDAKDTIVVKAP
jgi:hypothetical protein